MGQIRPCGAKVATVDDDRTSGEAQSRFIFPETLSGLVWAGFVFPQPSFWLLWAGLVFPQPSFRLLWAGFVFPQASFHSFDPFDFTGVVDWLDAV